MSKLCQIIVERHQAAASAGGGENMHWLDNAILQTRIDAAKEAAAVALYAIRKIERNRSATRKHFRKTEAGGRTIGLTASAALCAIKRTEKRRTRSRGVSHGSGADGQR